MAIIAKLKLPKPPKDHVRRLKSVPTLPTLFTLANLGCGFAAIHFALRAMLSTGAGGDPADDLKLQSHILERLLGSFLTISALFIYLGIFFDLFDGLLARVTRRTSDFGGQLDSLADMVTSGVAPAVLVVAVLMRDLRTYLPDEVPGPFGITFMGRLVWVTALIYTVGTAIRLARFNVEHTKPDFSHKTFHGLPCPGASALIAGLVMLQDAWGHGTWVHETIIFALPFVAFFLALLMVSRIPYTKVTFAHLRPKRPFNHLIVFMMVLAVFVVAKQAALALLVLWYVLSGPVYALWRRVHPTSSALDLIHSAKDTNSAERAHLRPLSKAD